MRSHRWRYLTRGRAIDARTPHFGPLGGRHACEHTRDAHTHVRLPLYVALRRSTSLYDMLRELAKTIIPRSQWAASYVDVMPTARHAKVAASWGGAGLFTVFWLIGDDSFCWLKNTIVGGPEEEDK